MNSNLLDLETVLLMEAKMASAFFAAAPHSWLTAPFVPRAEEPIPYKSTSSNIQWAA